MQLNLRGNVDHRKSKYSLDRPNKTPKTGRSISETRVQPRAHTEVNGTEKESRGMSRTVSNLSQYSVSSDFSKSFNDNDKLLNASRKNIISSAPNRELKNKLIFRKYTPSPSQPPPVHVLQPKRIVRWRDVPKENMYWQVIELPRREETAVEKAVDVKPVAIIQQKKVLKFATASSPEPCPAPPSVTPNQECFYGDQEQPRLNPKSVRFTKARYVNLFCDSFPEKCPCCYFKSKQA